MLPELTVEEQLRYSRQTILPDVGIEGQQKLKSAKVLLIGAGGLGSPVALYLAAAGVGRLGVVDFDNVDLTNLHRQVIHGTPDVGRPKLDSAVEAIARLNPNVAVVRHDQLLTRENALAIVAQYDLVIDGTDNFSARYLVNDACVLMGKRNMYGSILGFEGQATVFCAPGGPCYRCLYPEPPPPGIVPSCAEGGVFGVLPGVIGLIQATEALKALIGIGESLVGRLMLYDALAMRFSEVKIRRDPDCPICGDHPSITELVDYEQLCGPAAVDDGFHEIEPSELLATGKIMDEFAFLDVREPYEFAMGYIPGATLIPVGQLASRINEWKPTKPTIVYCRSGIRSATACEILVQNGISKPLNLRGGIIEWMNQSGPLLN